MKLSVLASSVLALLGLLAACGDPTATPVPAPTTAVATTARPTTAPASTTVAVTTLPATTAVATTASATTVPATTVAATTAVATTAATTTVAAQDKIMATHVLADTPLGAFQNAVLPGSISNDRKVLLGGIGSDLWHGPNDPANEFWMVTDRGPNGQIKVDEANRRTFPVPEFTPLILQVKIEGTSFTVLQTVPIVGQSGKPVTGLSNIAGFDETPYDYAAQTKLSFNPNGLDSEGLVRTSSGDFWLCEEYSPSILKVDKTGKVVKRYIPEGLKLTDTDYPLAPVLPAIFGKRKVNRGFEGLALSKDEKTLYAALQSPLYNPDKKSGDASRNTRIVSFDLASEKVTAEYVYRLEPANEFDPGKGKPTPPEEMKVSGLVALNSTTLLVLERTDNVAKLYTVDMSKATNIAGGKWDDSSTTPTLETLEDPTKSEINFLPKSLVLDLGKLGGISPKIEGVAVLDRNTVAVSNDNDFDLGKFDAAGNNVGEGSKNKIFVISLAKALPLP